MPLLPMTSYRLISDIRKPRSRHREAVAHGGSGGRIKSARALPRKVNPLVTLTCVFFGSQGSKSLREGFCFNSCVRHIQFTG
jgi:hypothetical protein